MCREEWNEYYDEFSKSLDKSMTEILKCFINKYNIHQVSEETSTMEHYRSNWDLYFYSNRGWNGKDYMDYFSLSFNDRRTLEQNMYLLEEIISLVDAMEYENIGCRIQYDAAIDEKSVKEAAYNIIEKLVGKFISYRGMIGKIKVIKEENGIKEYGFFKKGARNRYYSISDTEILAFYL